MPDEIVETTYFDFTSERLEKIASGVAGLQVMVKTMRDEAAAGNDEKVVSVKDYIPDGFLSALGHIMLALMQTEPGSAGEVVLSCDNGVWLVSTLGGGTGFLENGRLDVTANPIDHPEIHCDN